MSYLSFLRNGWLVQQIELPQGLDNESVINLDTFLRKCGLLKDNEEIAVTKDL